MIYLRISAKELNDRCWIWKVVDELSKRS